VTVDLSVHHQVIEGWGTCMITYRLSETPYRAPAWREAYRDLGLNILRMNMKKDVLVHPSGDMSVPVPLGPDIDANIARMDFSHPKVAIGGEMAAWLRKNALEPDRVRITGAIWSPPHWMKGPTGSEQHHAKDPSVKKPTPWLSGGKMGDSIGGRLLQTPQNLEQFARYFAAWLKGFERHYRVPIYAASIQNELSFENSFDSMTYSKGPNGEREQWWQYASALKAVKDELTRQRIGTKVMGPHMAHVGKRPEKPWGLWQQMGFIDAVKAHPDRRLVDFLFAYNSNGYLGTDEDAVKMWAAYYRGIEEVPGDWARWVRAPGVAGDGKPIWVSEAGGAKGAWLTGEGGAPGNGAITVAQKLHNALVHANASAYVYWQMGDMHDHETEHNLLGKAHLGDPTASKKYCAFKHFSRYIRPGAIRVTAHFSNGESSTGGNSPYDTLHALNVSAYAHEQDRTLIIVLVNMRPSTQQLDLVIRGGAVSNLAMYLTSNDQSFARLEDLHVSGGRASVPAPGYSVVTLHGNLR
jgi:O-glycosyl hydrolase